MNPLRALFLSLSKMPPVVMLLIVIGLAVLVTMMVTSKVSDQESRLNSSREARSSSVDPNRKVKQVVYSRTYIPAGATIENKQVEMRGIDELDVFDDAKVSLTEVVGTVLKRPIPAHAQIRKVDLEAF